jgi:demethylmenaquinone methyltransferase/2-methoxy-6-polyprenyl-1,4-benzoquinol methylase
LTEQNGRVESSERLIASQLRYYGARAAEYDTTSLGDRTSQRRAVPAVAERLRIDGDVLELGCGTGMWTVELARYASSITALDGAPEMLALARERLAGTPVDFILADLFQWHPTPDFDVVFSAFVLSHIPPNRFAEFWTLVAAALRPGGRAVMIDEAPSRAHLEETRDGHLATRTLSDGARHQIVKIFYEPDDLAARVCELGWDATVTTTGHGWFVAELTRLDG